MKIDQLSSFEVVDYLKTEQDIVGYFNAVKEKGDPVLLQNALRDIDRAREKYKSCY